MPIESRNPSVLAKLALEAASNIPGVPDWPASAPTVADLQTPAGNIVTLDESIQNLEDSLRIARQQRRDEGAELYALMRKVDTATDLIYGDESAQKTRFGCEPRKAAGSPGPPPLKKLTIVRIADGTLPGSIFVDFDAIEGAVYEIEWSTDANFGTITGTKTATASEGTADGLTMGTQYWIRVRADRAGEFGPWSDPATRVANV